MKLRNVFIYSVLPDGLVAYIGIGYAVRSAHSAPPLQRLQLTNIQYEGMGGMVVGVVGVCVYVYTLQY
jgi:hypothetical protein